MESITNAWQIAGKAFQGKTDLSNTPYINHLERVYDKCDGYDTKTQVVAVLHDLLEDCPEWNAKSLSAFFYDDIVDAIVAITRKSDETYDEYIDRLATNKIAKRVKLADLLDNMDITRLKVLKDKDIERLKKYHRAYTFLNTQ